MSLHIEIAGPDMPVIADYADNVPAYAAAMEAWSDARLLAAQAPGSPPDDSPVPRTRTLVQCFACEREWLPSLKNPTYRCNAVGCQHVTHPRCIKGILLDAVTVGPVSTGPDRQFNCPEHLLHRDLLEADDDGEDSEGAPSERAAGGSSAPTPTLSPRPSAGLESPVLLPQTSDPTQTALAMIVQQLAGLASALEATQSQVAAQAAALARFHAAPPASRRAVPPHPAGRSPPLAAPPGSRSTSASLPAPPLAPPPTAPTVQLPAAASSGVYSLSAHLFPCPRLFSTQLTRTGVEDYDIPVLAEARRGRDLGRFKSDSGAEVSFGSTEKVITMAEWSEAQFLEYYTLLQAQIHAASPLDVALLSEVHSWQMEIASVLNHVGAWSVARQYMVARRIKFVQGSAATPLGTLDILILHRQLHGSVVVPPPAPPAPGPTAGGKPAVPCLNCKGTCPDLRSCKAKNNACTLTCSRCKGPTPHWVADCSSTSPVAIAFDKAKRV